VSVAAKAGYAILSTSGTALDAVEAAVVSMENNQIFNAGYIQYMLLSLLCYLSIIGLFFLT